MHVQPGHFNWPCVNILTGWGDTYSTAGADAFEKAAIANDIKVCTKAKYDSGKGRVGVKKTIKEIITERCCRVTVVFPLGPDLIALLLEAHEQKYDGEWVVGDNVVDSLGAVVTNLKMELEKTQTKEMAESSVHKLMRGMYVCMYVCMCACIALEESELLISQSSKC